MTTVPCRNEKQRVLALRSLDILDTPPEATFDRFARLAAGLFDVPIARVSLVDADREFLKAGLGCEIGSHERSTSFCTWTVAQDDPFVVPDLSLDPRFAANPRVAGPPYYRFYAGAPLKDRDGNNLGAICCLDLRSREAAPAQVKLLQDLAQVVMEAMDLRRVATTDSLTGAMTRRAFMDAARRDIRLATRTGRPLTGLLLDVDHFKAVNDTYGHAAGDEVLRRLSALCRRSLRASDYCGRLGGEEFAILLRDTATDEAFEIAERLREALAAETFVAEGSSWGVTASFGLSSLRKGGTTDVLLAAADAALYAAKRMGRNRTMMCEADGAVPMRRPKPRLMTVGESPHSAPHFAR